MANSNLREIFLLARAKAVKIFWNPGQQQLDIFPNIGATCLRLIF
jgi:hypothetical protein